MHPSASPLVTAGIAGIALLVALSAVLLSRRVAPRAVVWVAGWMALTLGIAASGVLRRTDILPPPFLLMFVTIFVVAIGLARSEVGARLSREVPLSLLVLFQGYRFPLELVMHAAGVEGTMPVALSFDGYNFDILTGASAIVVGLALRWRGLPLWVVHAWNVLGMVALANIAGIALLSSPLIRHFGEDQVNTWVTYPPFIWLPGVLVVIAVAGHGLVLRALLGAGEGRAVARNEQQ